MSTVKHFIGESIRNLEIEEFLMKELERAGYGGADITNTPLGTRIIVYAMKPGLVIGRRGTNIRDLTKVLEEKFGLMNPQIAIAEIEIPEFHPAIMAARVVDALQRGIHFRRAGFWALSRIMEAGALGAEVVISGKLRTRRHRHEKYREGYIPTSGEPASRNVKTAVSHVKLKSGVLGIRVKIVPPEAEFPDQIKIVSSAEDEANELEKPAPENKPESVEE